MKGRLAKFEGLSAKEESELLALTPAQKKLIAENDAKMKREFLTAPPPINHGSVKNNSKYTSFVKMVQSK